MTVDSHLRIIWRARWRVLLVALVVAGLVYAYESSRPKVYRATAQLNVVLPASDAAQTSSQDIIVYAAQNDAVLGQTVPVLDAVNVKSGLGLTREQVKARLSLTASSLGALDVAATGPSAAEATQLGTAAVSVITAAVHSQQQAAISLQVAPLDNRISSLRRSLVREKPNTAAYAATEAELSSDTTQLAAIETGASIELGTVAPATAAPTPIAPRPFKDALLAFITALIVAAELSALLEYRADRFSVDDFEEDVRRHLGLPVLAGVTDSPVTAAEGFRTLRTNLAFIKSRPRSLAIVGTDARVGKTFIAIGLAQVVSGNRLATGLIEADLRGPSIARYLTLAPEPGLVDVLAGKPVESCVQRIGRSGSLAVLAAGVPVGDTGWLLGERFGSVLEAMDFCDLVIVDTPAEDRYADALAVASQCDAIILVVDVAISRRRTTKRTVERLRQVQAAPVGVVVNGLRQTSRRYGRVPRRAPTPKYLPAPKS